MNLPRKTTSSAGFTLIELMIVVVIIGIISAGMIPAFSTYIRSQNLKQAQEQLKSDMRTIQNKALNGTLSDVPIGTGNINFWGIKFVNGQSTYDYFVSSTSGVAACPSSYAAGVLQGHGSFSSGLTTQGIQSPNTQCVFFDMTNGDISSSLISSGTGTASVGYSATEVKRVFFNSSGLIYSTNQ
jgi:prepilin-type N-terminal cleavage/methylation domain-containing protein